MARPRPFREMGQEPFLSIDQKRFNRSDIIGGLLESAGYRVSHKSIAAAVYWLTTRPWDRVDAKDGAPVSTADVARIWVYLRLQVPRLVVEALDGDREALMILYAVRRELDPTIEVPWRHIPNLDSVMLFEESESVYGERNPTLVRQLRRIWHLARVYVEYGMYDFPMEQGVFV